MGKRLHYDCFFDAEPKKRKKLISPMNPLSSGPAAAQCEPFSDTDQGGPSPIAAVVVAAGQGRRFGGGDNNKVLYPLAAKPIWQHAVESLRTCARITEIVLVIRPDDFDAVAGIAQELHLRVVAGGSQRYDSVRAGLEEISRIDLAAGRSAKNRWVAIHDAARPLVTAGDVHSVIEAALTTGAAILATPIRGTVKRRNREGVLTTVDRADLWEALTPQVFRFDVIDAAYRRWRGRPVTDDAEMVERSGFPVTLVPGSAENLKITQSEDLAIAQAILSRRITPVTDSHSIP